MKATVHSANGIFCSISAEDFQDVGDHDPGADVSASMIEHVAIPAVNEALDVIGETPLDPRRLKQQSYGKRKFEQLQAGVQGTLQIEEFGDDF